MRAFSKAYTWNNNKTDQRAASNAENRFLSLARTVNIKDSNDIQQNPVPLPFHSSIVDSENIEPIFQVAKITVCPASKLSQTAG
jgi:hypothetical protein